MNDFLAVALGVFLGVSTAIPVALIVVIALRQPHDVVDFTDWYPPDEITEETAVTLYFDVTGRAVAP